MQRNNLLLALCILMLGGMRPVAAQQPIAFQIGNTPDGLQKKLRPPTRIGDYSLQLATEFAAEPPPAGVPAGSEFHGWSGTPRANGTRLSLMCNLIGLPPADSQKKTLDAFAKAMIAGIRRRNNDWKQTAPQSGTLNGMTYISYGWSGMSRVVTDKGRSYGWIVVLSNREGFVELAAQDVGMDAPERLHLAEASVRTFQRTDAPLPVQAQQSSGLTEWVPVKSLLPKLGPIVNVEGYALQLPTGYKGFVPDITLPEGVTSYFWLGEPRPDGTNATFSVTLLVPPIVRPQSLTLNRIAADLLAEFKADRREWTQTPAETGTIQGMTFVRNGWSGVLPKENRKMQGWIMVARDGDTLVRIACEDVAENAPLSLQLAETAARTFKRLDSRLLFSEQEGTFAKIYAVDPDGSNRICLTPDSETDYHPALSPDGTAIVFTTHRDGMRALYLMDSDGSNQRRLTPREDAGLAAWSRDGRQLAFSSNRDGRYRIYVMNRDGSNLHPVSQGPSDDNPDWSVDGERIVYEGVQNQTRQIFVTHADGSGAKQITRNGSGNRFPRWSPDGSVITYTRIENGKGQIYAMRPDGTADTHVIISTNDDRQATFTADNRQLLFHSRRAGRFDLYAFDPVTQKEQRLTTASKDSGEVTTLGRSRLATPVDGK